MFIERLEFGTETTYSALESSIHLGRYSLTKQFCLGKKILDIACGEGYGAYAMAKYWGAIEVHGVDISDLAITTASNIFNEENLFFHCNRAEKLDDLFSEKSFDVIVSFETIEHLQDPSVYLLHLKRLLKDDGIIIISCPNDHWYYKNNNEKNPFHERKYTFHELSDLCETYLGKAQTYLLGLPLNGYSNIEINSAIIHNRKRSMQDIFAYDKECSSLLIPSQDIITSEVSSYFIGVWSNRDIQVTNSSVHFPYPMNKSDYLVCLELKEQMKNEREERNKIEERLTSTELLNSQLIEQEGNYKSTIKTFTDNEIELNKKILHLREQELKNKDSIQILQDTVKQFENNNNLLQLLNKDYTEQLEFNKRNQLLLEKNIKKSNLAINGLNKENQFLRHNLWLMEKQIRETNEHLVETKVLLESTFNSRSWRITSPLRFIVNLLRRLK